MKRLVISLLVVLHAGVALSQALTSFNFRDVYNPDSEISIQLEAVRSTAKIEVYCKIESRQNLLDQYIIRFERRDSYTQRQGISLPDSINAVKAKTSAGILTFDLPAKPWLLVVIVTNKQTQKSWIQFKKIESIYPVSGWFEVNNERIIQKYLTADQAYQLKSNDPSSYKISYYDDDFPAAYPPFAETEAKADRFLFHDSTFVASTGPITFHKMGLYLLQHDTMAAEGFAVRAVNKSFPKFTKVDELIKPLIFICTQDEYAELQNAKGEKAKIDKVILDITGDKERASKFMRSFFRHVELSNIYFASYKEGWKTDRGMIYLIFGVPDEVSVNDGSEVWYYSSSRSRFSFVKSGTVYDPDNFVLLRDKRFMEAWFSTIDLWRKSRF